MASLGSSNMTTVVTPTTAGGSGLSDIAKIGIAAAVIAGVGVIVAILTFTRDCWWKREERQNSATQPHNLSTAQPLLGGPTVVVGGEASESQAPQGEEERSHESRTQEKVDATDARREDTAGHSGQGQAYPQPWTPTQVSDQIPQASQPVVHVQALNITNPRMPVIVGQVEQPVFNVSSALNDTQTSQQMHQDVPDTDTEITRTVAPNDLELCQQQVIQSYKDSTSNFPAHPVFSGVTVDTDEFFIPVELSQELYGKTTPHSYRTSSGKQHNFDKRDVVPLDTWEDLFKPAVIRNLKNILSGGAGCGKSTLLVKIANACTIPGLESSVKTRFKVVFLLQLKQMRKISCIVDAILDQILPRNTNLTKERLKKLIDDNEAEIAFLLDGLDEIPADVLNSAEGDYRVQDILHNKVLVKSYILVTTRPRMIKYVLDGYPVYAHIQTSGFSTENMMKYIERNFSDDVASGDALILSLRSNESFLKLAEIPIISLMLCLIWKNQKSLPEKLTKLYKRFAKVLIHRRSGSRPKNAHKQQPMIGLGQVAIRGLLDPKGERLMFDQEEFKPTSVLDDGCHYGFLQPDEFTRGDKCIKVASFLHKSFQEYCAACYLVDLLDNNKSGRHDLMKKINSTNVCQMENLLRFCCGLSPKAAGIILEHIKDLVVEDENEEQLQRLARLLLFESGSKESVGKLARPRKATCVNKDDLVALAYYLESIPEPLEHFEFIVVGSLNDSKLLQVPPLIDYFRKKPTIEFLGGTLEGMKHLERTLESVYKDLLDQLHLIFGIQKESYFDADYLSGFFARIGHEVGNVYLVINERSRCDVINAAEALRYFTLDTFALSSSDMHGHINDLASLIKPSLKQLVLGPCELNDDDVRDLIKLLTAEHDLEELNIGGNEFSLEAVKALTDHLKTLPKLRYLKLDGINHDEDLVKQVHLKETEHRLKRHRITFSY